MWARHTRKNGQKSNAWCVNYSPPHSLANEIRVISCPVRLLFSLFWAVEYLHMQLRSFYLSSREITFVRKRYQALSTFTTAMFESCWDEAKHQLLYICSLSVYWMLNKLVLSKKGTSNTPGCLVLVPPQVTQHRMPFSSFSLVTCDITVLCLDWMLTQWMLIMVEPIHSGRSQTISHSPPGKWGWEMV